MSDHTWRLESPDRNSSAAFWLQTAELRGIKVKPKTSLKSKKAAREGFQMLPQAEDLPKNMAVTGGSLLRGGGDLYLSSTVLLPSWSQEGQAVSICPIDPRPGLSSPRTPGAREPAPRARRSSARGSNWGAGAIREHPNNNNSNNNKMQRQRQVCTACGELEGWTRAGSCPSSLRAAGANFAAGSGTIPRLSPVCGSQPSKSVFKGI